MISPKKILRSRNIRAIKQLGQHFLNDRSFAEKIVELSAVSAEDVVLEIGSGLGSMTLPLSRKAKTVFAVEKDYRLINFLKTELLADSLDNIVLIEKDILDLDIKKLAQKADNRLLVIGNLPYNISSQIIVRLINSRSVVSRAILMFQKELAKRMIAQPGCRDYSRLTVMLRYCSDTIKIADAGSSMFYPKPKVDSTVLEIKFKSSIDYPADDEVFLFRVIKAGFGRRRKTLKNALAGSELHIDAGAAMRALEFSGIDPGRRAETLSVEEFVGLSNSLGRLSGVE